MTEPIAFDAVERLVASCERMAAASERAAVVAWLRRTVDAECTENTATMHACWQAIRNAADAIERGAHLDKPRS